jgi:hypothetical protein
MLATTLPYAAEISRESDLVDYASNLADAMSPLEGVIFNPSSDAKVVGALANALLGMITLPELLSTQENAPPEKNAMLLGAVVGGFLGYLWPAPVTAVQGYLVFKDSL